MSAFVSVVIAAVGAVAWALCFAATPVVFLPWIALVPLILVSRGRGALWLGLVHGTVFWLLSINWIIATLESYGGLSTTLAIASLLLLSAYLGLYHAVFAWVVSRLWRRSAATLVVALPALWVVLEVVRGFLFSGFPWNLATYSVIEVPGALQLASVVGPYGVSFMVVAVNGAIAVLVTRGWKWRVAGVLASVAALLAVAVLLSPASSDSASGSDVRIIQPNTPILEEWDSERIVDGYRSLMAMSHDACEPGVLLVWPESAAWPYMMGRDLQLDEDIERLTARGCSVIVNSVSRDEGRYFNSAYLLGPENFRSRYDKGHLVPFGEYVPLGRRLPFLKRLARAAGDFSPGATRRQLSWTKDDLGLAICFEIVFPGEVAARVRDGATILVTITNDGWYGDTAAPWQHFRAARFRAAENRRPLVRAALTGVSAFVSPHGEVTSSLGVGEKGVLQHAVRGRSELTFYSRFPWLVTALCWLLLGFAILPAAFTPGAGVTGRARGKRP